MSVSEQKDEKISTRQVKEWRATGRDSTGEDAGMGGERGGTRKGAVERKFYCYGGRPGRRNLCLEVINAEDE